MKTIKVVLIDDHQLVRAGIRELLGQAQGVTVVGEAASGQEGMECVRNTNPDLVLLDLLLPDTDGLTVTKKLLRLNPDLKIFVVSSVMQDLSVFRLLEAGARGYAPKTINAAELTTAIKAVYHGQRYIHPQFAKRLALMKMDMQKTNPFSEISEREMAVLERTIRGVPVKEIAETLDISEKTVHSYRDRIFRKLGVDSDVAVMLLAVHYGLMKLETV